MMTLHEQMNLSVEYREEPLLFTCYVLEADIRPMGAAVADKKYDKPANPEMSILVEARTGMIIACDMKLKRVKRLKGIDEFWEMMRRYR